MIAELPHNDAIAEVSRRFWAERIALDGEIVERAISRGEIPQDTEPRGVIEAVLVPLHFRLLIKGTPASPDQIQRVVDLVVAAIMRTPRPA